MPAETLDFADVKPLDLSEVQPPSVATLDFSDVKPLDFSDVKPLAAPRKRDEGMGGGKSRAVVPQVQTPLDAAKNLGRAALEVGNTPLVPLTRALQGAPKEALGVGIQAGLGNLAPSVAPDVLGGAAQGAAEMVEGLTTPTNLALMEATGGLGLAGKLPLVGEKVSRALGVVFSGQMLHDAYTKIPEVKKAVDEGDYGAAAQAITTAVLETGMGALGLKHAATHIGEATAAHNVEAERLVGEEAKAPTVVDEVPVTGLARPLTLRKSVRVMGYDKAGNPRGPITVDVLDESGAPVFSGDEAAASAFLAREKPARGGLEGATEPPAAEAPPAAPKAGPETYDTPNGKLTVKRRHTNAKGTELVVYEAEGQGGARRRTATAEKFAEMTAPKAEPETLDVEAVKSPDWEVEESKPIPEPLDVAEVKPVEPGSTRRPEKETFEKVGEMGSAIVANMYDNLWSKVEQGKTTEAGGPSTVLTLAKRIREKGGLQSKDDFLAFAKKYGAVPEYDRKKDNRQERTDALNALTEKFTPAPEAAAPAETIPPVKAPEAAEATPPEPTEQAAAPVTEKEVEPEEPTVQKDVDWQESKKPEIAESLALGSTRVLEKGDTVHREKLVELDPAALQANPENKMYPEKVAEYVEKPSPIPIEVRELPDGGYLIHEGHHRVDAAKERGDTKIRTWVPVNEPVPSRARDLQSKAALDAEKELLAPEVKPQKETQAETAYVPKKGDAVEWTAQGKTYRGTVEGRTQRAGVGGEVFHTLDVRPDGKKSLTTINERMARPETKAAEPETKAAEVETKPALVETKAAEPETKPIQKQTKAKNAFMDRVREFYTPGNVIHVRYWNARDKVLSFNEEKGRPWSVTVQRVDNEGKPLEDPRTHHTPPDKNDRIVARAEAKAEPKVESTRRPKAPTPLHEELAQSGFDKPYSELTDGQRESIELRAQRRLAPLPKPEKKPVTPQIVAVSKPIPKAAPSETTKDDIESIRGREDKATGGGDEGVPEPRRTSSVVRRGSTSRILIPGENRGFDAHYAVRELADVIPSHNPSTLQANPDFAYRNDRNYADQRNSERIINQTANFDPSFVLTDSPTAVDGAPIVDRNGHVLGGNSRAMSIARVYGQRPEMAARYKQSLADKAEQFGLNREHVEGMTQPVLVRELTAELSPKDAQDAITDLNKAGTASLSTSERAIADSNRISPSTLEQIAGIIESEGPSGTLAAALDGKAGTYIVDRLIKDGVITTQEKPTLFDGRGVLTPTAKDRISKLLLGRVFDDSAQFESAPPALRNKLERIIAPLSRLSGKADWDLMPDVKRAIAMIEEARATGIKNLDDLVAQQGLFGSAGDYTPRVVQLAKFINANGPVVLSRAFNRYANDSKGPTMFGEANPQDAFADAFGMAAQAGERGSAALDFLSGGLVSVTQKLAGRVPGEPERHKKLSAHLARTLLPGQALAEVEAANKNLFMDWVRAASHEAISSNMIRTTVSAIKKELKGSGHNFDEMRLAYTQSRLSGIRDQWLEFSDMFEHADNDQLVDAFHQKDSEGKSFWLQTLSAIQGKHGLPQDLGQTAAALLEREDFDTLRTLMSETMNEAAANVQDIMPEEDFQIMMDFLTANEVGQKAHQIYKENIEGPLGEAHARNEGVFTGALGPLETYIPLTPLDIDEKHQTASFSKRAPMKKPRNPHSYFATGLSSTGYTTSMETFGKRIQKAVKDNNRAAAIQAMIDSRWAKKMPDDWDGTFVGPDGREYTGTRETASDARTLVQGGKVINIPARQIIMPRFMADALRPILDREFSADSEISRVAHMLNSLSVQWTPAELIYHGTGLIGTLNANTPFIGKSGLDKFLSAPVLKFLAIAHRVATVDPSTPENLGKLREMADVGALPAKVGKVTFDKEYAEEHGIKREHSFAPFLYGPKGLDVRTRIVMYDIYKAAFPDGTPRDFYHFINQLGNYTPELQGPIERWFKGIGLDPFATAGMTRQVNAFHAWTGTGPNPNWQARLWQLATGGAVAAVALWALSYKYLTGEWPTSDKRAKLFMIPVGGGGHGKLDKYRHSAIGKLLWGDGPETGYLSWAFFFPIPARGARLFGLQGAFEARQLGGSPTQILDAAQKDIVNTVAMSRMGPVASAAAVGLFGAHPYVTQLHDRGRPSPRLLPAIPFERKEGFFGGLAPSLVPGRSTKHPGFGSEVGARTAAAVAELNGFYGDSLRHLGVLGEDSVERGNPWVRTFIGLTMPNLVQNATNPYARANALRKER